MSILSISASREKSLKAFVKRHSLFSMYLLMFVLAWSIMIPQALYSQGILSAPLPEILEILTGWAPATAAIVVSALVAGRAGVRELRLNLDAHSSGCNVAEGRLGFFIS